MRGLVDLRYCPSSSSTLRSVFTHQGSINKQLASKTVADNTRVHPHMYLTVVRPSRGVLLNRVVQQASLPPEFVASRGLSLMLMSRRKVKAGFTMGWTCPQSMLSRAPTQLFRISGKTGAQWLSSCSPPLASTIPLESHPPMPP